MIELELIYFEPEKSSSLGSVPLLEKLVIAGDPQNRSKYIVEILIVPKYSIGPGFGGLYLHLLFTFKFC